MKVTYDLCGVFFPRNFCFRSQDILSPISQNHVFEEYFSLLSGQFQILKTVEKYNFVQLNRLFIEK